MTKINLSSLFFLAALVLLGAASSFAQEGKVENNAAVRPFRLLQELNLSREQIQQIRRINQERKDVVQEAQRKAREANRALDIAIYADAATEEQVRELTKAAQMAQADLIRERTTTEFLIRRVLTPEQLVKFRELREMMALRIQNRKSEQKTPAQQRRPANTLRERRNQNQQPE